METAGSLRARKRAATESALQEAALSLFVEKGYDATTIEEIVAEADVSRRTFFRYFGSKEEVIFKGAESDLETLRRLVCDRPGDETDLEALKYAIVGFVKYLEVRDAPVLRFINVITNSPTLNARGAELQGRWTSSLAAALAERAGVSLDIKRRLLASLGMAAIAAGVASWASGESVDLESAVKSSFVPVEDGSLLT